jgi:hypothetical protein
MSREIDLVLHAAGNACLVVEKATNVLWTPDELREAGSAGQYQQEDRLAPAANEMAVSGPFPGCLQGAGAPQEWSRQHLIGQTRHFLLFVSPDRSATFAVPPDRPEQPILPGT